MKDPNTTAAATLRALLEKRTGLTASSKAELLRDFLVSRSERGAHG